MKSICDIHFRLRWLLLAGIAVSGTSLAESDPGELRRELRRELDMDILIVEPGESPDQVIQRIPLPPPTTVTITSGQEAEPTEDEIITESIEDLSDTTDQIVEDTAQSVTDDIVDTLSSGDTQDLPEDVVDSLQEDVINDLSDDVEDITDNTDTLPEPMLNEALDELENSLDDVESDLDDIGDTEQAVQELNLEAPATDVAEDLAPDEALPADVIEPDSVEPSLENQDLLDDATRDLDL